MRSYAPTRVGTPYPDAVPPNRGRTDPIGQMFSLPWDVPLEEWTEHVVPLPRGLSRHVVRIVRLDGVVYAVKETQEAIAWREYTCCATSSGCTCPPSCRTAW